MNYGWKLLFSYQHLHLRWDWVHSGWYGCRLIIISDHADKSWNLRGTLIKPIQTLINRGGRDHTFWNLGDLCGGAGSSIYQTHVLFNPAISLFGVIRCTFKYEKWPIELLIAALLITAKDWKQPKCPMEDVSHNEIVGSSLGEWGSSLCMKWFPDVGS